MAPRLWEHPLTIDGAYTSNDPECRKYAIERSLLAVDIADAMGCDLMVHFACKDMNRNMIEARAYALKRAGVTNLLVITGDYPVSGFFGQPKPVFDIDSVTALHYLTEMNRGLETGTPGRSLRNSVTSEKPSIPGSIKSSKTKSGAC